MSLLDSATTFWPWSHSFGHLHSAIPSDSPLLNFDPVWAARKLYACQCCYNSNHATIECPLPHLRLGGVPVVSFTSRDLVMRQKPVEQIVVLDRLLNLSARTPT